jgi:hypothetical protein
VWSGRDLTVFAPSVFPLEQTVLSLNGMIDVKTSTGVVGDLSSRKHLTSAASRVLQEDEHEHEDSRDSWQEPGGLYGER